MRNFAKKTRQRKLFCAINSFSRKNAKFCEKFAKCVMKIHIFLRFFANIFVCWKPYLPLALYLFCVMLKNRTIATFDYFLELRKERKELKGTVSVISSDPPCKAGHT